MADGAERPEPPTVAGLIARARGMAAARPDLTEAQRALLEASLAAATTDAVTVPGKTQAVFFTVSKQPTKENKDRAFAYVAANPQAYMIDDTAGGAALERAALFDRLPADLAYMPWFVLSTRFAQAARGDVHVEWANAHPLSTSLQIEAPALLANPHVPTLNGVEKRAALAAALADRLPAEWARIEAQAASLAQAAAELARPAATARPRAAAPSA